MADSREKAATTPVLRPELIQTIEHLRARWARADTRLLRHAFPLLAEGCPVSIGRLAEAAGTTVELAGQAIGTGRVALDGNGHIVEVFGVTLSSTLHRIRVESADLYSCCALVAHVMPRLLGRAVKVHSQDPVTGNPIKLAIGPDDLRGFQPDIAMASMIVTDERTIHEDASVHFCQHVRHFGSRKTADDFVADNARRYVITIAELDAAADGVFSAIWS